jgi:CubicO group peptidase (beta-lactamase class C family)
MPFLAASAVQQLMTDARVPGLSMAVIDDRQATAPTVVGLRNSLDSVAVDQQTIFATASLSKPLFAYAVLKLVDAGKLAFDTPVAACAGLCCRRSPGRLPSPYGTF